MKYEVFCIRTVLVSLLAACISLLYIWFFLHIYYILYITKYINKNGNQWLIDMEMPNTQISTHSDVVFPSEVISRKTPVLRGLTEKMTI